VTTTSASVPTSTNLTWKNWAGNQTAHPSVVEHPMTEEELVAVVQRAAAQGQKVKVVGSGHSFTDIAVTNGRLVILDRYDRVLDIDPNTRRVTVQVGITLSRLNIELDRRGLALANLGDITYQTVAGAISTSTHGTGRELTGLGAFVVALRIIAADGTVYDCDATTNAEIFHSARVGLGALGVLSTVTLAVVPAFNLVAVNEPLRVDDVLANLDAHIADNDHFEFYWVPHTGWALTKRNNRTTAALAPRPKLKHWWDSTMMENHAFGLLCRVGRAKPTLIPRLSKALPSAGRVEYTDQSYKVFASERLVKFYEMEYSIPLAAATEALNRVRAFVKESGLVLNFPVEVRFTAADDVPLSTGYGEPRCYIAVHVFQGMEYRRYFEGVEAIMNEYAGRPHWGKLHFQTVDTLAPRYPEWSAFAAVRNRLDPSRIFSNPYLDRVLGP
jgi:L-gulono-1,4-lactone dehydrogenase